MRFKDPLGEQVQEILLPHEFFAALYEHDATFHKVVVPEPDICKKFWKAQKAAKHPALDGHPLQRLDDGHLALNGLNNIKCPRFTVLHLGFVRQSGNYGR